MTGKERQTGDPARRAEEAARRAEEAERLEEAAQGIEKDGWLPASPLPDIDVGGPGDHGGRTD